MHPQAEKTRSAIAQIRQTRDYVSELLADTPEFQTRAEHVFDTLANGLEFAIGGRPQTAARRTDTRKEVADNADRTIMGQPVPAEKRPMTERVLDIQPSRGDIDKLREDVDQAYANFLNLSNKEIRNTLTDLELRGVAKRAGMNVTKTEPAHFTDSLINEIKTLIEEKAAHEEDLAREEQEAQARKAADSATEGGDEGTKDTPPAPEPPKPAESQPKRSKKDTDK